MARARNSIELGKIIRQYRLMVPLTSRRLAVMSGISPSYLGRIERGERFPSAAILKRIAGPLGLTESELFSLAGYLSSPPDVIEEKRAGYIDGGIDPYVSRVLSGEPVAVQRAVIGILTVLKSIAKGLK